MSRCAHRYLSRAAGRRLVAVNVQQWGGLSKNVLHSIVMPVFVCIAPSLFGLVLYAV